MIHQAGIAVCDGCKRWEPVVIVVTDEAGTRVNFQFNPKTVQKDNPATHWRNVDSAITAPRGVPQPSRLYCPECQKAPPAPEDIDATLDGVH